MAVDKNKLVAEATRFVLKGQYDKAIKAYEKVYAEDRKDTRVLLKIGELQQKKGDSAAAGATLNLVAEAYREQGFFLKAVSVYKQVAKLAPDDVRVNERLAELYQQLGLMSEATGQLQAVAVALERTGEQGRLLETLRRMVDLDPENVASCVKLGDLYTKAGKNAEALELFRRAAGHLRENKRVEEYLKVAERIALLAPDDLKLTRELAHAYLSRGDTKRALAKLQLCFKAEPKDVETLRLLAQAFRDLGQSSKTTSVYKELARVYEEKGRRDEARLTWKQVLDLSPEDAEAQEALGAAPVVAAAPAARAVPPAGSPPGARAPATGPPPGASAGPGGAPPPVPAAGRPRAVAAGAAGRGAGADSIARLLTEADVYRKYGLHQKALEHLQKVLAQDAEHVDALDRVCELRETLGDRIGAADAAERAARALLEHGPEDKVRAAVERLRTLDPSRPSLPELAGAAGLEWEQAVPAGPGTPAGEDDLALAHAAAEGEEVIAEEGPEAAPALAGEAAEEVAEPAAVEEVGAEDVEAEADASEELAVAGQAVPDELVAEVEAVGAQSGPSDEPPAEDATAVADEEVLSLAVDEPMVADAEDGPQPAVSLEEEVASISALAPEGPEPVLDEPGPVAAGLAPGRPASGDALPPPELEFVPEEEVEPLAATVEAGRAGPEAIEPEPITPLPAELEFVPEEEPAEAAAAPPEPPQAPARPLAAEPPGLAAELEEVAFYEGQGLLDEALGAVRDLLDGHPGHPLLAERLADLEAQVVARGAPPPPSAVEPTAEPSPGAPQAEPARAAPADGDFDIGRELAAELGPGELPAPSAEDFQYSVEDVFDQFKRGVEKAVRPEDSDTHYDLGIAYKEMGLLDDALGEFRTALTGKNRRKEVDLLTMIGLCHGMKGEHREAVQAFRHALHSEYLTGEAAKALHYELGAAHEALGETAVALWYFQKIVKVDPRYRDARAHVERLGGGPGQPPANATSVPRSDLPTPSGPTVPAPAPAPAAEPSAPGPPPSAGDGAHPDGARPGPKKNIGYV